MSGHSKWAQIKRQKAVVDAKKGQAFTKLAKAITSAAKTGGSSPDMNPSLRFAIDQALAANMPKDNIERAIERASGADASSVEHITFEAYGPGGVAFLIQAVTDNRNRTVAEVRHILTEHQTSLGKAGSVVWQFDGRVPKQTMTLDTATAQLVHALIDQLNSHDDVVEVVTNHVPT